MPDYRANKHTKGSYIHQAYHNPTQSDWHLRQRDLDDAGRYELAHNFFAKFNIRHYASHREFRRVIDRWLKINGTIFIVSWIMATGTGFWVALGVLLAILSGGWFLVLGFHRVMIPTRWKRLLLEDEYALDVQDQIVAQQEGIQALEEMISSFRRDFVEVGANFDDVIPQAYGKTVSEWAQDFAIMSATVADKSEEEKGKAVEVFFAPMYKLYGELLEKQETAEDEKEVRLYLEEVRPQLEKANYEVRRLERMISGGVTKAELEKTVKGILQSAHGRADNFQSRLDKLRSVKDQYKAVLEMKQEIYDEAGGGEDGEAAVRDFERVLVEQGLM